MTRNINPSVVLSNVCKAYPKAGISLLDLFGKGIDSGYQALTDVSLTIHPGETVGILGSNGAGKSTLLQVVVGTLLPSSGTVATYGKISALLELGAGFNSLWTGRRNAEFYCMMQGASVAELPGRVREIEDFADIGDFFEQPMRTYSSGMFLRVAFAAAIAIDPDIVIVDEALAVGDARFQNKCFNRFKQLQQAGKTIILVTHDAVMVSQFCNRGIVLQAGRVVHDGLPDDAVSTYRQLLYGSETASGSQVTKLRSQAHAVSEALMSTERPAVSDILRSTFSWPPDKDALRSRAHYNPHESVAGSSIGQIIDIQLLDETLTPCGPVIVPGTRVGLAVQLSATRSIVKPSYGLVIKSKENVLLFGVSNIMLKQPNFPINRGEELVICFKFNLQLARGEYFIDIGLAEADGSELDVLEWRMSVCHFTVDNPGEMYGIVDMNAAFYRG